MSASITPPVVLLCGGLGMRIREEADFKPKAMVEIGGRPIIWHIMRLYERHGFDRFIVCLGYRGERIREYFLNYEYMNNDFTITIRPGGRKLTVHAASESKADHPRPEAWEVTLAETGQVAMTGARVRRVDRYIDSDIFLCTYGDGVSNVNLSKLVAFHRSHGKLATITGISPISRFGTLVADGDHVSAFSEKPELNGSLINGGFFVFDKKVMSYLSEDDFCVLEREPFAALARDGQMMVYRHTGYWQCMDTPRDVKQLNDEWQSGHAGWLQESNT